MHDNAGSPNRNLNDLRNENFTFKLLLKKSYML